MKEKVRTLGWKGLIKPFGMSLDEHFSRGCIMIPYNNTCVATMNDEDNALFSWNGLGKEGSMGLRIS